MDLVDQMEEFLFLALRTTQGVCLTEFQTRFGYRADVLFADFFRQQAERGLLIEESDRIYLTTRGLFLADLVFRDLIGWLKERPQIMNKED